MHTLIFDIGKTNKKLFLFDDQYREIHKEYVIFDTIDDEDGYPSDNLSAIKDWIRDRFEKYLKDESLDIEAVNFSTYGASLVHIDRYGKVLTPLYNYTKPIEGRYLDLFNKKYNRNGKLEIDTGARVSGMLNSGIQLFWIKHSQRKIYDQIRYSLHFPQYLGFMFSGLPVSDFTSIGCHTSLWDFRQNDYHEWVLKEGINHKLAPIISSNTSLNMQFHGKPVRIGFGIHDSSAALLPYIRSEKKNFLLISTGTWSVSMNPFTKSALTRRDIERDTVNYMRIDGRPVKASKLFLGNEYRMQTQVLSKHFGKEYGYHRGVKFDAAMYHAESRRPSNLYRFESLGPREDAPDKTKLDVFENFESAFHRLMIELMELQVESAESAIKGCEIKKVYVDGGFADNDIYVNLARNKFSRYKLRTTKSPLGSALGAAMVISDKKIKSKFLKKHYAMRKHEPLILQS